MKQVIEYMGTDNAGNDLYRVDDRWKSFRLTKASERYILKTAMNIENTVRKGDYWYLIVDIAWKSAYKTIHIALGGQ